MSCPTTPAIAVPSVGWRTYLCPPAAALRQVSHADEDILEGAPPLGERAIFLTAAALSTTAYATAALTEALARSIPRTHPLARAAVRVPGIAWSLTNVIASRDALGAPTAGNPQLTALAQAAGQLAGMLLPTVRDTAALAALAVGLLSSLRLPPTPSTLGQPPANPMAQYAEHLMAPLHLADPTHGCLRPTGKAAARAGLIGALSGAALPLMHRLGSALGGTVGGLSASIATTLASGLLAAGEPENDRCAPLTTLAGTAIGAFLGKPAAGAMLGSIIGNVMDRRPLTHPYPGQTLTVIAGYLSQLPGTPAWWQPAVALGGLACLGLDKAVDPGYVLTGVLAGWSSSRLGGAWGWATGAAGGLIAQAYPVRSR